MPRRTEMCRVTVSKHAQRRYQQYGGRKEFLSNRRVRWHVKAAQRSGLEPKGRVCDVEIGEGMKARVIPRKIGGWFVLTVIPPPGVEREIQMYEFTVPGRPVPKARPRVVQQKSDPDGWGQLAGVEAETKTHTYTPQKTAEYEELVGWEARAQIPEPLEGKIEIEMKFFIADERGGDWDNLGKSICDALNGIAYTDDSQITDAIVRKRVCRSGPERAEIKVGELDE